MYFILILFTLITLAAVVDVVILKGGSSSIHGLILFRSKLKEFLLTFMESNNQYNHLMVING